MRSAQANVPHIFGIRYTKDDQVQAYILIEGKGELAGRLVSREELANSSVAINLEGGNRSAYFVVSTITEQAPAKHNVLQGGNAYVSDSHNGGVGWPP